MRQAGVNILQNDAGNVAHVELSLLEESRLRVFENNVLRILGPKRYEVSEDWRRLHNEELYDLYSSPTIIRVIKSRRMRLARHVARMRERRIQGFSGITCGKEPL
jgi:hypothetical protein